MRGGTEHESGNGAGMHSSLPIGASEDIVIVVLYLLYEKRTSVLVHIQTGERMDLLTPPPLFRVSHPHILIPRITRHRQPGMILSLSRISSHHSHT